MPSYRPVHVYLSGPIESVGGNWNFPLFEFVTERLRTHGYSVFNPCEFITDRYKRMTLEERWMPRRLAFKTNTAWICEKADVVLLLPGWEASPGAMAEYSLAKALKIFTYHAPDVIVLDVHPPIDTMIASLQAREEEYYDRSTGTRLGT